MDKDKFGEYKFVATSTQHLEGRRQGAIDIYLGVNAAIVAVFGILVKDAKLTGWALVFASLPLFLVGFAVCIIWYRTLMHYKTLIAWRYEQLIAMEKSEALAGSHRIYTKEWEDFFRPRQKKGGIGFSQLEAWLPRLFMGMYLVYIITVVTVVALGLWQPVPSAT